MAYSHTQHLLTEIGPCIDTDSLTVNLQKRRGAQTLIATILRAADLTATPYYGYALRCSCSKKGEFHTTNVAINSEYITQLEKKEEQDLSCPSEYSILSTTSRT